ncbi:MAG: glutamate--tRNA ligase, partial [Ligilactobacillus saerimneri]|nr:glutamate--tRNA ligase [Ligilactobacillus saerimneri]
LYKMQMSYTGQLAEMASVFFTEPPKLDEAAKKELADETAPVVLNEFAKQVNELPIFDAFDIQAVIRNVQKETGVRGRKLYMPIRIATTRAMHGPDLAPSIELLGKEKALKHLQQTLDEMAE